MFPQDVNFIFVFLLTYALDSCVGREYSLRTTKYGKVKGIIERQRHSHQKIEKFLGIPYASPPVGKLRLQPPLPPKSWGDGIRKAIELPPACPQPAEGMAYIEYHVPDFNKTSEDCLFLNIYLPKATHHKSMPVLVFIHGGSYQNGMGAMFDGSAIAARDIVVVTFNYRLGPLGFLTAADDAIRGNYGMLDMIQALRWIQENIVYFRGDPGRVTIDGHSAGGCSVGLLMLSPLAKGKTGKEIHGELADVYGSSAPSYAQVKFWVGGFKYGRMSLEDEARSGRPLDATDEEMCKKVRDLVNSDRRIQVEEIAQALGVSHGLFHQVIQQSGSPLAEWSVARHETKPNFFFKSFISSAKCFRNTTEEMKKCIQTLDSATLETIVINEFEWSTSLVPQYRPIIDGHFLPQAPEELIKSGKVNANSFMTGATMDEGLIAAIPLIKLFGVAQSGVGKLLSIMRCFRNDLPDITGIVDYVIDQYVEWSNRNFRDEEIERAFSQIVGDYFITAPTHLMAEMVARINMSVYVYNYEYKSLLDQWDGVIHGAELFYLSGCPFTGHKNFRYDQTDKDMATALILLWSNFIKHGTPSLEPGDNTYLPAYKNDRKLFTRIYAEDSDPVLSFASDLRPDKMSFWNKKVPSMYRKQYKDFDDAPYVTINTGANMWILISVCICLSVLVLVLTIGYYRLRQRVVKLLRQLTVPNGVRLL